MIIALYLFVTTLFCPGNQGVSADILGFILIGHI